MIFDDDNMHFGIHAFRLKAETYQRARTCARRKLFQRRETKILPESSRPPACVSVDRLCTSLTSTSGDEEEMVGKRQNAKSSARE